MFDTHCHLTNPALSEGLHDVLEQAAAAGVHGLLSVATDAADAAAALTLATTHEHIWCTAGVHPSEAGRDHDLAALNAVADHPRCLAWGELGLDRHWPDPPLAAQITLLEAQLDHIKAHDQHRLPIVIHCRKAVADLLPRLLDSGIDMQRFVFHCFTETPAEAQQLLDAGVYLSFTGVVTYTNASDVAKASDLIPLDRLMIETDAPYLSPEPVRKVRPNQPAHVAHTAAFLAARRGLATAAFLEQVDTTARNFYGFPA